MEDTNLVYSSDRFYTSTITNPTIIAIIIPTIYSESPHKVWAVSVIALACGAANP